MQCHFFRDDFPVLSARDAQLAQLDADQHEFDIVRCMLYNQLTALEVQQCIDALSDMLLAEFRSPSFSELIERTERDIFVIGAQMRKIDEQRMHLGRMFTSTYRFIADVDNDEDARRTFQSMFETSKTGLHMRAPYPPLTTDEILAHQPLPGPLELHLQRDPQTGEPFVPRPSFAHQFPVCTVTHVSLDRNPQLTPSGRTTANMYDDNEAAYQYALFQHGKQTVLLRAFRVLHQCRSLAPLQPEKIARDMAHATSTIPGNIACAFMLFVHYLRQWRCFCCASSGTERPQRLHPLHENVRLSFLTLLSPLVAEMCLGLIDARQFLAGCREAYFCGELSLKT